MPVDLAAIGQFVQGLIAQHPIIYTLLVVPVSMWALTKAELQIPRFVNWAEDYQDRALRRAGLSEAAIIAVDERELKDMRAAADAFEKEIAERKAKLAAPAPAPTGAAPTP